MQQEDITPVNSYILNIGAPKYVKQILMNIKGQIDEIQSELVILTHL